MGTTETKQGIIGCNEHCAAAKQVLEAIGSSQDSAGLAEQISEDATEHVAGCDFVKTGQCALVGYMAENTVALKTIFEVEQEA